MSLPTVPRDLVPLAPASLSLTLQYELPEPGEYDGQPVTSVLWSVEARSARPRCSLFGPPSWDLRANMVAHGVDPVPAWVPRPPASWLALVAEMAGAVGLDSDEPLPVVAEAIAQAEGELGIDYTSITRDGIDRDDLFPGASRHGRRVGRGVVTPHTLPSTAPRTLHIANLAGDDYQHGGEDRPATDDVGAANVVSSISSDSDSELGLVFHYPVLDIDIPAALVPSSTPGHFHLYLDRCLTDAAYWELCDALANAGILQPGYVSACKSRGYTSVRLPWVRKTAAETSPEEADAAAIVAQSIAQAEADHQIAELARAWHPLHAQYRAETEGPEGHLKAATWARLNRALVALAAALDAEAES